MFLWHSKSRFHGKSRSWSSLDSLSKPMSDSCCCNASLDGTSNIRPANRLCNRWRPGISDGFTVLIISLYLFQMHMIILALL